MDDGSDLRAAARSSAGGELDDTGGATDGASDDQPSLFTPPPEGRAKQAAVERSLDAVRARFGTGAIGPGATNSLHREGSEPPTR